MDTNHEMSDLLVDAWKLMALSLPSGTVHHAEGVISTLGNVPLPFLNVFHHDGPLTDIQMVRDRLGTAKARGADCDHPWLFSLCEDWAPIGWEAAVAAEGLVEAICTTGMAADALEPPRRPAPELDIRRIDTVETARDLAVINAHAYDMPPELFDCMCNLDFWGEDMYGYVGYLADGTPVSSSGTFPVNGTVYVAFVATHPDHHRKGYAEAVMRHSVEMGIAGTGLTRTTLHATEAGLPVYEAMGYEGDSRFHLLLEPHD